jgi:pimeloyl-ACP methyl ester carboxylesterase
MVPRRRRLSRHAPDQRGYGRTTGCDTAYDCDLRSFDLLNIVRDTVGLVSALGFRSVAAVVGHDFGSPVAAWCALVRPDVFHSVILMSAPFPGPPTLPFDTAAGKPDGGAKTASSGASLHARAARSAESTSMVLLDAPAVTCMMSTGRPRPCAPTITTRAPTDQNNPCR